MKFLVAIALLAGCLPAGAAVSVESLLREMADPLAPTQHPGNAWRLRMQSSHDARSVAPGEPGNLNPGFSSNLRHRVLDAIPFADALRFDMELSHWRDCRIGYRWTTWLYLRPKSR